MLSLKEIKEKLEQSTGSEAWITDLQQDKRSGAKKIWASWNRKQQLVLKVRQAHEEKVAFDRSYSTDKNDFVAGVDEAGRGPLAGPVVTAAVILSNDTEDLIGLDDSKQLSRNKRNELAIAIKRNAVAYSIHFQSVEKIDELNIYEATKQSMTEAVLSLEARPNVVLVDAMKLPINIETHSIVKGDAKSLAIAAASILAKTARDEYMDQLHEQYPMYLFNQHAGYGTKLHIEMIEQYGPTQHHRKTFEPIKSILRMR